jgi:hypothetical protein
MGEVGRVSGTEWRLYGITATLVMSAAANKIPNSNRNILDVVWSS